jgi:hypothetical protein
MLVNFENLPEHSRIWIYQADRSFSDSEISEIREALDHFLTQWTAHGAELQAGYELPYNRFIVIGLDQSAHAASGCSIDASVHFIQALEKKFGVELLDRMNVSFKQGPHIAYKPLSDFRKLVKNKSVSKNTVVFNNLVTNKLEYTQQWEVPASESWHARLFSK